MIQLLLFSFLALSPLENSLAEDDASVASPIPSATVVIEGRLIEKGTKKPIPDANVYILPAKLKATTDVEGKFRVEGVPEGEFTFVVNLTGYEKLEQPDDQLLGAPSEPRTLFLPKASYQLYETTVYGKENQRDDSTKSLKASVATKLPGSNNDPIKAVQNLPGVSRVQGLSSQVIIQGSAPQDTRYLIDGHEVPIIFHYGGYSSVILPESLDRIDYLSAGYGPEFGRAMGGQIDAWTRKPDRDRTKGFVYVDTINAGGAIETGVGEKGSLIIGARQSYIGAVLKAASTDKKEEDKDDHDAEVTAAPSFRDLTVVYDTPLSDKDDFRTDLVFSQDSLDLLVLDSPGNDPILRGNFDNRTTFVRLIPQWTHHHDASTTSRWSLGLGRDWVKFDLDDQFFKLYLYTVTARGEVEKKWNDSWTSYFGTDDAFGWAKVSLNFPNFYAQGGVANPISTGDERRVDIRDFGGNLGFYWNNDVKLSAFWSTKLGVRLDYFGEIKELHPAPRLSVKRELTPYRSIRLATGLYFQPPQAQEIADGIGNPDLTAPRAIHVAATYAQDFRRGMSKGFVFEGGPFAKRFDKLVVPSTAIVDRGGVAEPEFYTNTGEGYAYGVETLLRYEANPWTGWLSYTASKSTRRQPGQPWYPSAYDQTHNVNLIVAKDLEKNWRISGRFRYTTGNPITPVVGSVFDADNDAYIPTRGPYFSERVNAFYQLDLRVDKKWIYNQMVLTAYLDIQNVTNHRNVEGVQYAYDYSTRTDIKGLPIFPQIGVKGEF